MALSAFDLFSVGIGPSSSHTVGPMRAAGRFVAGLERDGLLADTARVRAELFGSLGATGLGHGSRPAVVLGLLGEQPELVDTAKAPEVVAGVRERGRLALLGRHEVAFSERDDVVLNRRRTLPEHPNGMELTAYDASGDVLVQRTYFSVGGGFVVDGAAASGPPVVDGTVQPYPYGSAAELLEHTRRTGLSIAEVVLANECAERSEAEVREGLLHLWSVMQDCVRAGCEAGGQLPGGLKVRRRASQLRAQLEGEHAGTDPLGAMDWVNALRARGQRGERRRRARRHRPHQRRRRDRAGGPALLRAVRPGGVRRRRRHLPADGRRRSASCTRRTPRSPAPRSAARARSARPARWPPPACARCWAARRSRSRTPPRSAWSTTSA